MGVSASSARSIVVSSAASSLGASTNVVSLRRSASFLAAALPVTLPIGPRVPPTVAARYAASPYSAMASGDNKSRPACALSRTCCAISVGISAAAPVATPRPIAPNFGSYFVVV